MSSTFIGFKTVRFLHGFSLSLRGALVEELVISRTSKSYYKCNSEKNTSNAGKCVPGNNLSPSAL